MMSEKKFIGKERPDIRERTIKRGISYPTDAELVMMILGSGTQQKSVQELAEDVINTLDATNCEDTVENLLKISGMGKSKSLAIAAALELGKRRNSHLLAVIKHPKDVIPFVKHYTMQKREHFVCITLNGGHELLQIKVVSIGTSNSALVNPKEIFCDALTQNAAAIIVCHNHPSENCEPSREDIETTEKILAVSEIVGIPLLDHIILKREGYFSFLEHGLLFNNCE